MSRFGRFFLILFALGALAGHDYVYASVWATAYVITRVYPLARQMFDL